MEQTAQVIGLADEICQNSFVFRDHWEMEKTNVPYVFEHGIQWDKNPFGDPEWIYALNRHTCLVHLAKAWEITKKNEYTEKFLELAEDWMDHVPLTEESRQTTWRSIEAGIRCGNWLQCRELLSGCPVVESLFWDKFLNVLYRHGEYLMAVNDPFHRLSNWGILQNHGLLLLGIYFKNIEWEEAAKNRLTEEMHTQIMGDGIQWEQSPMYHCEVLHCILDSIESLRTAGKSVPADWEETARNMLSALAAWCKPNHHIPCQSDSDDIDASDLLQWGRRLFPGELFLQEESAALTESGNYMLRCRHGNRSDYLRFHCGCMGSGHGHADQLHMDLFSGEEDILIDSGRYTYVDNPVRRRLKGPAAHNTIVIDQKDFSVCANSWGYVKMAVPLKGEYKFTKEADFVSGAHLGYLEDGILVNRKIVAVKEGIYIIADECVGTGKHQYEQYWHFSGKGKLQPVNEGRIRFTGEKATADCFFLKGTCRLGEAEYSPEYNLMEKAHLLTVEQEKEGNTFFYTVIITREQAQTQNWEAGFIPVSLKKAGRELGESQAQAVRVFHELTEHVVIFCHEEIISEVDLLSAGSYSGYGRVLYFSDRCKEGRCLQY